MAVRDVDQFPQTRYTERTTEETSRDVGAGGVEVLDEPMRPHEDRSIFITSHREPVGGDWIGPRVTPSRSARR